jgi:hypothetical protein
MPFHGSFDDRQSKTVVLFLSVAIALELDE